MRQLQLSERGSANWPFIITLILLLVFVYLWWEEQGKREEFQKDAGKFELEAEAARQAAGHFLTYATDLSKVVGYTEKDGRTLIPDVGEGDDPAAKAAKAGMEYGRNLAGASVVTDIDKLSKNLTPDGVMDDGSPGLLNFLANNAEVEMAKNLRTQGSEDVTETEASFEWMTDEFKQKLAEVNGMEIPQPPVPVIDADDTDDVDRYELELKEYEKAVAAFEAALGELQEMEGFKKFDDMIKGAQRFNPGADAVVKLDFFNQALTGRVTVEAVLGYPKQVIPVIIDELRKNKEADAGVIAQVRTDASAKETLIDTLQSDLATEQQQHTQDVQTLQGELAAETEKAETNRLAEQKAMEKLLNVQQEKEREVADAEAEISALQNRVRIDKEERDLKIRRDLEDGRILSASPVLGTAIINLGSQDKIYPGLRFNVSYTARGGDRVGKGQIEITQILGKKSAKARILTNMPGNPIGSGDIIHNPLWSVSDPIHVWLAGELEKYPIDIARARLERMGVVLDRQPNADTAYIVIPNAMAAPAPEAGEEEEDDEDDGAVGGQTEFEKIQGLARAFGAQIITEKMLNTFLDY